MGANNTEINKSQKYQIFIFGFEWVQTKPEDNKSQKYHTLNHRKSVIFRLLFFHQYFPLTLYQILGIGSERVQIITLYLFKETL